MSAFLFHHKVHLTDEALKGVYATIMAESALASALWYDGLPENYADWRARVVGQWLVLVTDEAMTPQGVFWLDGYMGRSAQIHFAIYEAARPKAGDIGRATLAWLGEQNWLQSVYGVTPATHRHVFPFLRALGFQILGRVAGACWIERKQQYVPGVVSAYDFRRPV